MRKRPENLKDLSPLLLKRRIERLRRQLIEAQDAVPEAEEKDRQWHLLSERGWAAAREELIQVRPKLAALTEQIHKAYPSSTLGTFFELFLDYFGIEHFWKGDRSAEVALYKEKYKLQKRYDNLRGIVGSLDAVPKHHENPYSKRGPGNFNQLQAQSRVNSIKAALDLVLHPAHRSLLLRLGLAALV